MLYYTLILFFLTHITAIVAMPANITKITGLAEASPVGGLF